MNAPGVCARTIGAVYAAQFARYRGPNASSHTVGVVTDGPWAYVGWGIGEEGGQSIFRYTDGRWCRVMNGGGSLDEASIESIAGPAHGRRLWQKMQGH